MRDITTQAIVLKNASYRDNDQMLTLLSPMYGRMDVMARGVKKAKSHLTACSELFAYGEFVLVNVRERITVTSCQMIDNFYPLREDYEKLKLGTSLLQMVYQQSVPQEKAKQLFTLLIRSLKRMCYTDLPSNVILGGFLLFDAIIMGYRPTLESCSMCGARVHPSEVRKFSTAHGGVLCKECGANGMNTLRISPSQIEWMMDVLKVGVEQTSCSAVYAPVDLLQDYVKHCLTL